MILGSEWDGFTFEGNWTGDVGSTPKTWYSCVISPWPPQDKQEPKDSPWAQQILGWNCCPCAEVNGTDTHSVPLWSVGRDKATHSRNLTLKLLHTDYGQLEKTQIIINCLWFSANTLKREAKIRTWKWNPWAVGIHQCGTDMKAANLWGWKCYHFKKKTKQHLTHLKLKIFRSTDRQRSRFTFFCLNIWISCAYLVSPC